MEQDTLTMQGGAVKALNDNTLGGYLVLFGDPATLDADGEYFDKATDYGIDDKHTSPVLWNHGSDPTMKRKRIGKATIGIDDVGVWIEAQLHMRDEYEKAIMQLAQAGKLGWSSGTASHLVDREQIDKGYHITAWPLGIDASLTPTPADPRNRVTPLKSLTTLALSDLLPQVAASQAETATKSAPVEDSTIQIEQSEGTMDITEEKLTEMLATAAKSGAELALKSLPAANPEPVAEIKAVHDNAEDKPWGNVGEFLLAVKNAYTSEMTHIDPRLRKSIKAPSGLNEGVDSAGGFLVDQPLIAKWFERMYTDGAVLSRVTKDTVGAGANGIKWNGLDETSRATGSRWGGVRAYWGSEAGSLSALQTKPAFKRMSLDLEKIYALYYATEEELQDAAGLTSRVGRYFENEFRFTVEDAVLVSGTGVGMPLGVLGGPALVSVAKETGQAAATVVYQNVLKMWSRMWAPSRGNAVWFINQDVEPQLMQLYMAVGTGGVPVWMPANGISGSPYATLFGRPIIPVEYCPTLGTVGDIMLVDLSQYEFIDKGGVQQTSSIHVSFLTGETAFRFMYRCNGMPEWKSALTPKSGSANTLSPYVALATRS